MNLLRECIKELLKEQNVQAAGMCFPFAYQKADEWFENHFIKGKPGRAPQKHRDLNNKDKFKVVHGTVTNKWKSPPKPIVHGWVEMGDLVFDDQTKMTKPDGIDKEVYYDMYQPEVYKEFTAEEAIVNCVKYGGEGPWDDELYAMHQKRDAWMNESQVREYIITLLKEAQAQEVTYDKYGRPDPTPSDFAFMKEYKSLTEENPIGFQGDRYWYMGEIDGKYCLVITSIEIDLDRGGIYFNSIQTVPPDVCEGQGFASKVMNKVTGLADKHGVNLRLQASAFGQKSVSDEELISWYKRAGFEQTDPDYSEILTRQPQ